MILSLLLLSPPALAWRHEAWGWPEEDHPVTLYIHPDHEESLPEGAVPELLDAATASWTELDCDPAALAIGEGDGTAGAARDNRLSVSFNDPDLTLGAGVIAVTTTTYSDTMSWRSFGGEPVQVALESDIVFNDYVEFYTDAEIDAGACSESGKSFQATATHELGHVLGLGHACERGEDCLDPALEAATMNWTVGNCDASRSALSEDDANGLFALYGSEDRFGTAELGRCAGLAGEPAGVAPFQVECSIAGVDGASWDMGDGATESGATVTHTYTEPGLYNPAFCGSVLACEGFTWCGEAEAIAVCGDPEPRFTALEVEGAALRVVNDTPLVYGCVAGVAWTLRDEAGALVLEAESWNLAVAVPAEGLYELTLEVSGPGGSASYTDSVWAGPHPAEQGRGRCAAAPVGPAWAWLLALCTLGLRRRRCSR